MVIPIFPWITVSTVVIYVFPWLNRKLDGYFPFPVDNGAPKVILVLLRINHELNDYIHYPHSYFYNRHGQISHPKQKSPPRTLALSRREDFYHFSFSKSYSFVPLHLQ